jgi:hypothetical protein
MYMHVGRMFLSSQALVAFHAHVPLEPRYTANDELPPDMRVVTYLYTVRMMQSTQLRLPVPVPVPVANHSSTEQRYSIHKHKLC